MVRAKEHSASGFIQWLEELKATIGIPRTLSDVGVKREQLGRLVDIAVADGCHPNNPRPVSRGDFEQLFQAALA
jgi:alcohol dehydrogenase class IV